MSNPEPEDVVEEGHDLARFFSPEVRHDLGRFMGRAPGEAPHTLGGAAERLAEIEGARTAPDGHLDPVDGDRVLVNFQAPTEDEGKVFVILQAWRDGVRLAVPIVLGIVHARSSSIARTLAVIEWKVSRPDVVVLDGEAITSAVLLAASRH
jgi:hypothetical protein